MKKRILVTGGAGFIGTNLVRRLAMDDNNEIIVIDDYSTGTRREDDSKLAEFIRHDVIEPFRIECDEIYHLACPASPVAYQSDPIRTTMTAVQGTLNALRCAEDVGARILIASTSEVYGEPLEHPQSESLWAHFNPVGERSCYDAGKAAAESLAANFSEMGLAEVRIARIHNTYGPEMDPEDGRMVSNFIVQALTGDEITVYGDGSQTRSLCYITDMVDGLIGLMANDLGEGQAVNLGNPRETTVREVAEAIIKIATIEMSGDVGFEIAFEDLPSDDPTRRCPNIEFANRMFNFEPIISLEDGLRLTFEHFRRVVQ